ncbi:hypothetical protein [Halomicrococcus gelatinilyticus]|uniref:hypothetical protein n=1 Tax=Halomicrococcus gelatinilyticus TaxID=1702103 RepID=UPI002E0FE8C9
MPQRSRTRESDDVADLLDDVEPEESSSESDDGFRARAKQRAVGVFSPRFFLVAAAVSTVAMLFGGAFVPLGGSLAGLVSVFLASFVLGAVTSDSRILETAAGGALGAGLAFLLQNLMLIAIGGVPWAVVGAGAGFLVGALGAYFGNDLRDGLTREI